MRNIMVVDDDIDIRESMADALLQEGYHVLCAENGEEALNCLTHLNKEEIPGCIFLDLMMPVMDGFEFIVNYSQIAEWLSVPVLVLTAKDPSPDERRLLVGLPLDLTVHAHRDEAVAALFAESEGNPLFVEECVRALAHQGALASIVVDGGQSRAELVFAAGFPIESGGNHILS